MSATSDARLEDVAWGFEYGWRGQPSPTGSTRFVRTADLGRGSQDISWTTVPFSSEEPPQHLLLRPGDILVARNGEGSIGNSAVVLELPGPTTFSSNLIRLVPKTPDVGRYLACFMRSPHWSAEIGRLSSGAAIPNISSAKLRKLALPLFDEVAQARAIELCEETRRDADEARVRIGRARTELASLRAAAANEAVRGNLQSQLQALRSEVDDLSDSLPREPGLIDESPLLSAPWPTPSTWTWSTFGAETESFDAMRRALNASERAGMRGDVPYIGASGEIDRVSAHLFDGEYLLVSEDGSNLRARRGPIAHVIRGRFWAGNHVHVSEVHENLVPKFLALVLNRTKLDDLLTGVAQPKLSRRNLNRVPIPVPPREEQRAIVAAWSELDTPISDVDTRLESSAAEVSNLEAARMAGIFSGQLVPLDKSRARQHLNSLRELVRPTAEIGEGPDTVRSAKGSTATSSIDLVAAVATVTRAQRGAPTVEAVFKATGEDLAHAEQFFGQLWELVVSGAVRVDVSKSGRGQATVRALAGDAG
jgi:type I restriction enzyme S subunit